jgi:hypothetical protein
MANDLSSRVWYLDTAGVGVIYQPQVWIKFIEWYNPANADQFQLTDRNGKPIVEGIAEAAGDTQTFNLENIYEGLILKILTTTNQGATPPGSVLLVHIK